MDPVTLFFILGALAGFIKSDLRVPAQFFETLSIYLLLAIGIKGGKELFHVVPSSVFFPVGLAFAGSAIITLAAYYLLIGPFKFSRLNAAAFAAHYGSVSAVTFAFVTNYCSNHQLEHEKFFTILLVVMEITGIATALFLYRLYEDKPSAETSALKILEEVVTGKSITLLLGGVLIGYTIAQAQDKELNFFFSYLFKGFLSIFMLDMGIVASTCLPQIRKAGIKTLAFAILMPLIAASIGIAIAKLSGFSIGGQLLFATLCASASYIAAPAAVRLAIPGADVSLSVTSALGITLPFNLIAGIPIYHYIITRV